MFSSDKGTISIKRGSPNLIRATQECGKYRIFGKLEKKLQPPETRRRQSNEITLVTPRSLSNQAGESPVHTDPAILPVWADLPKAPNQQGSTKSCVEAGNCQTRRRQRGCRLQPLVGNTTARLRAGVRLSTKPNPMTCLERVQGDFPEESRHVGRNPHARFCEGVKE